MLNARLEEELNRARRYQQPFSLLLLDLDHFKSINDAFGHRRGDEVLIEAARRIESTIRTADSLFRYGGDEFVILLPNTDKTHALATARRLLERFQTQPFSDNPPLSLSLSIGLAAFPEDEQTAAGLFEKADRRHQYAKRRGRNLVISETQELSSQGLLQSPSRLIERDMALAATNQFLNSLTENNRSVLRVSGLPNSGKSRLLVEIRKIARLRGYAVLAIRGRPSLKNRLFGVLLDAQEQIPDLVINPQTEFEYDHLVSYLQDKGQAGLLITIDELGDVDRGTLAYLRELFYTSDIPQLGLVYTDGETSNLRSFPHNLPLQEIVQLKPLTSSGLRIWLRQSLQWEAPIEFILWLHQETGGLPGQIQLGLEYLFRNGLLNRKGGGWEFPETLLESSLMGQIQQQTSGPHNNLPPLLVEIVDRVQEVGEIKGLVQEKRLVTVCGPSGAGKTTLVLQAASELVETFQDGVYFIELGYVSSTERLIASLFSVLNRPHTSSPESLDQIIQELQKKHILIILDHYWHRRVDPQLIRRFLEGTEQLHLLVTSRTPTKILGEQVYTLGGLELPPSIQEVKDPGSYSSCVLFTQIASRLNGNFQVSDANIPWITQICRLVNGLPLGIELAASWIQTMECEEIARRLIESQARIRSSQAAGDQPQDIIDSVLEAFWDLFSPADQEILQRLTVFQGNFRREMAQQIADASPFFLEALVTKAYLKKNPSGTYRLPDFMRGFLNNRSAEDSPQMTTLREIHARAYNHYIQGIIQDTSAEDFNQKQKSANLELENLLAAWEWVREQKLENQFAPLKTWLEGHTQRSTR
jgi:diguanylate cyclase (GGDEF)-like protein